MNSIKSFRVDLLVEHMVVNLDFAVGLEVIRHQHHMHVHPVQFIDLKEQVNITFSLIMLQRHYETHLILLCTPT